MSDRRDYGRWHDGIGYGLLTLFLGLAIFFAFSGEWIGLGVTLGLVAFVLWTLRRGS